MKKLTSLIAAVTMLSLASFAFAGTIKGSMTKATKNADGSYTIVVKDIKTNKDYAIEVQDVETMGKLDSKKVDSGDEIEVKFNEKEGKNINTKIQKEGGC
jgi:hypothetical protein